MDIRFDRQSLLIDRQRALIRAAEFHYWRLPAPELWSEVLLRIKAAGYNAVDVYYHWGFHSPKPNVYRWEGLRDVDTLHQLIEEAGLFLVARPGPYICAETDGGGFPGWLLADTTVPLRCRVGITPTASPTYLSAVQQWFGEIIPRILACENLIAFQIENEYITETMEDTVGYMEQMYSMVRGFGVGVPLFHNGAYKPGDWHTAVDICGHDAYPFSFDDPQWRSNAADALKHFDRLGDTLRPHCPYSPVIIPELQAGGFDPWGGAGYAALRTAWGRDRLGLLTRTALIQQVALYTHYMFFGGTNWDFLGNPEVYTSYDYGAPIHETLETSERYAEAKHLALMAEAFTDIILAGATSEAVTVDPPDLKYRELRGDSCLLVTVRNLGEEARAGEVIAPPWQFGFTLQPGTARTFALGAVLSPELRWGSNAELFTTVSDRIVFLVAPPEGAQLVLLGGADIVEYDPHVIVSGTEPRTLTTPGTGMHRILLSDNYGDYAFYIVERDIADRAWKSTIEGLDRVVLGPDLFLNDSGELRAFTRTPRSISIIDVNTLEPGLPTDDYDLAGPEPVPPPAFGPWTLALGGAEIDPDYDDESWIAISEASPTAIEQWGVYYGFTWYRAAYAGVARQFELNARHCASVYVNGMHVHSADWEAPVNGPDDEPPVAITLPEDAQFSDAENVIVVVTESLGHNKGFVGDDYRNPRGILGATLDGRSLAWRMRAGLVDGYPGDILGAERMMVVDQWDEHATSDVLPPVPEDAHLVAYTSTLCAPIPKGHWAPLEIEIDTCPGKALLVLNDTVIGRFWPERGPQHRFVVPPTWLDQLGEVEVTLIVWPRGETGPVGPVRAFREPVMRVTSL